jgi:transposase
VLRETYSRQSQTALGMITMTPARQQLKFRFTMFDGAMNTEMMIFFLTMVHDYYDGKKVMIIFDRLSAHLAADAYFERNHRDWFLFEYFPSYSPELNPVEQCWQHMKNVSMANFVPIDIDCLKMKAFEAAQEINKNPKLLPAFFHHAKLSL